MVLYNKQFFTTLKEVVKAHMKILYQTLCKRTLSPYCLINYKYPPILLQHCYNTLRSLKTSGGLTRGRVTKTSSEILCKNSQQIEISQLICFALQCQC